MHVKTSFLPGALVAALLQGLLLTGCGGNASPTGVANSGEVQLKLTGAISARSVLGAARSADVAGATVLVDGVPAGVTGIVTVIGSPAFNSPVVSGKK